MSLPEHLHPKTYWEERTALLEQSIVRLCRILDSYTMPPAGAEAVNDHFRDWNRLLAELERKYPPEPTP